MQSVRDLCAEELGLRKNTSYKRILYTLEPLRICGEKSLVCSDVPGLEWVKLRSLLLSWGGPHNEWMSMSADDLFAAFRERGHEIPRKTSLIKARFAVKFTESFRPQIITVCSSNCGHGMITDIDNSVVDEWLSKRGFRCDDKRDRINDTDTVLASM